MNSTYRIVHVEDSPDDAELVKYALRGAPFKAAITRVETEPEFTAQLDAGAPDLVICDYDLPRFSAGRALQILKERGFEVPFILVSHHIGENAAVVAMQQGASDYLAKGDLGRLPKAIEAALDRGRALHEKAQAVEALRKSEAVQRSILNSLVPRIALLDGEGVVVAVNKAWENFDTSLTAMAVPRTEPGMNYLRVLAEIGDRAGSFAMDFSAGIKAVIAGEAKSFALEYQLMSGSSAHWYSARAVPLEGSGKGAVISHRDVTDRMMSHVALDDAHKRLQALSKRMLIVQEEERRAISLEIHDDVAQTLSALKIGLHRLAQGRVPDPATLMAECLGKADAALDKLRQIALNLRPPQLDQLGLEDALAWLVERQRVATGLAITCKASGLEGRRPPAALESACYRIVQEALNNATRHAKATNVLVGVESDGRLLKLLVHDDGVGFDEKAARREVLKTGSMGLIGMEERAQLAGGRLKVRSVPGGGTTVSAIFPLERPADETSIAKILASAA
jgi:two-component system, NarL family, sensor histidine kinase UhpB